MVGEGRNVMDEGLHGGGRLHLLRESHLVKALHGGREIVGTLEERESTQRDEGGGGREEDTYGIKVSSILWDELNMSVIPKSKLPISFMNVSF